MAPPGGLQSAKHRIRRMHPAGPLIRRSVAVMDRASADQIRRSQERRLRMLVRLVARKSPFYRRWFAESGVDPASIRGLDDLPRLPLVTRADLFHAPADFAVYPTRLMWPSRSSGTSGRPITVYRTPGSSAYELAALQRQWSWFGLPRDARRVVLRGSDFAADHPGMVTEEIAGNHQLTVSSFHLTPEYLPEILRAVRAFRPHAVEGWPSSIALLAARIRDTGGRLPVQAVITSSELMSPGQQDLMRSVFEGPIVDHYGQTERVALAGTCEAGSYHVFPDYGIVELLPVAGRRAATRSSAPLCTTGASRCCATEPATRSARRRPSRARAAEPSPGWAPWTAGQRTPSWPPTAGSSRCPRRWSTTWRASWKHRSPSWARVASRSGWCRVRNSMLMSSRNVRCTTSSG